MTCIPLPALEDCITMYCIGGGEQRVDSDGASWGYPRVRFHYGGVTVKG